MNTRRLITSVENFEEETMMQMFHLGVTKQVNKQCRITSKTNEVAFHVALISNN